MGSIFRNCRSFSLDAYTHWYMGGKICGCFIVYVDDMYKYTQEWKEFMHQ